MSEVKNNNVNAEAMARKAQSLPPSTQFAIVTCLPNMPYGTPWGFASLEEVQDKYEVLVKDKNIIARKITGGCLIEVSPAYLLNSANSVQAGLVTEEDVTKMKKMIAEAHAGFEKWLTSKKSLEFDRVGIYSVNSSTAITIKGQSYPAFRVSLATALNLLAKYNFKVGIKGVGLVPAGVAVQKYSKELYASVVLSPTKTGAFLRIGK